MSSYNIVMFWVDRYYHKYHFAKGSAMADLGHDLKPSKFHSTTTKQDLTGYFPNLTRRRDKLIHNTTISWENMSSLLKAGEKWSFFPSLTLSSPDKVLLADRVVIWPSLPTFHLLTWAPAGPPLGCEVLPANALPALKRQVWKGYAGFKSPRWPMTGCETHALLFTTNILHKNESI